MRKPPRLVSCHGCDVEVRPRAAPNIAWLRPSEGAEFVFCVDCTARIDAAFAYWDSVRRHTEASLIGSEYEDRGTDRDARAVRAEA